MINELTRGQFLLYIAFMFHIGKATQIIPFSYVLKICIFKKQM